MAEKNYIQIPTALTMADMSDADVALIMDLEATVTKWFKSVKAEGKRRAGLGNPPPGYHMGAGKRSRNWKTEEHARDGMASVGINDHYAPKALPSVAAAGDKISETQIALLVSFWDWKPGTPSLKKTTKETVAQSEQPFGDITRLVGGKQTPDW